jgi:hypothetical protein
MRSQGTAGLQERHTPAIVEKYAITQVKEWPKESIYVPAEDINIMSKCINSCTSSTIFMYICLVCVATYCNVLHSILSQFSIFHNPQDCAPYAAFFLPLASLVRNARDPGYL